MSPQVSISAIGSVLKRHEERQRAAVLRGTKSGALRGRTILVGRTKKDRGMAKAAWKTVMLSLIHI